MSSLPEINSILPHGRHAALAELAFGSTRGTSTGMDGESARHLSLLPVDALELDLTDPAQRHFGDYELLELIGEGGMGVVYRAHQISLDREVAVKLLAAGPWASREFIERFQREAQNAARMQHPNIVAIYEIGSAEELHFFSMRLVRGPSLAHMLRDGPLPPLRAAGLLRGIAEAVDYAHRLNVLHLDLKPANVLLDEDGEPHVADFGLARRLDQAFANETGEVSGTPSYMAPEQALVRKHKLSRATDIWGLGAVLYELVTGQPPFRADSAQATLKLVIEGQVRAPRRTAPHLPLDLEAVILRCLAREPDERYASARALADDLTRFIEGRAVQARPLNTAQRMLRWAKREPRLAATALLAVGALLLGLLATTQQWRRAEGNARLAASNADVASERLWQSRIEQAATALRDGHAYDALPPLAANIREREAQGLDAREDRVRIATAERSAPRLIDVITLGSTIQGVALSPDGASVAVSTEDQKLRLFDTATGAQRWESNYAGTTRFLPGMHHAPIWLSMLRFSPDGRHLVGRHRAGGLDVPMPMGVDEILFDAASGAALLPPKESVPGFVHATYSADGHYALLHTSIGEGAELRAQLVRTSDWQALGAARPWNALCVLGNGGRHLASTRGPFTTLELRDARTLATTHTYAFSTEQRISAWAISPDGDMLVVGLHDGHVERIDFASGRRESVRPSPMGRIGWIAFSPDGRWFGAVADSGDVLVWDATTGQAVAPPMRLDNPAEAYRRDQMAIDALSRMVIASSDNTMAMWHLPGKATPPVRLTAAFPNREAFWFRQFAYDAPHGLIATDGGGNGELRLWRVQGLATTGLKAAPLPAPELGADIGRLVAVDGNRVRIVDAKSGQALGPTVELAQQPTFAELTADGTGVVIVVANALSVHDAATLAPRRAPIALPNSPARVIPSPDSRHVLLLFADFDGDGNRELLQDWDLVDGVATSPPRPVEPEAGVRFSPDGRSLLEWEGDTISSFDAFTLQPLWPALSTTPLLDPPAPGKVTAKTPLQIHAARFSADGKRVAVLTARPLNGAAHLWRIDAGSGALLGRTLLGETKGGEAFAETAAHGVIVQRPDASPLWWDEAHGAHELPSLGNFEFRALALSHDDAVFARGTADAVALTSARTLRWMSPLLPTAAPRVSRTTSEHPIQLAFNAATDTLIGRSHRGLWLRWNVAPDLRPVDVLEREARLLSPGAETSGAAYPAALDAAERAALRAQDEGSPSAQPRAPRAAIPPRRADAASSLVDLGAAYTSAISGDTTDAADDELPEFAPGLHRFLGVDYDVRGAIKLSHESRVTLDVATGRQASDASEPRRVEGIRPGIDRFDTIDVLVTARYGLRKRSDAAYAIVELRYHDGGRARLPIRYLDDVNELRAGEELAPNGSTARVAWRQTATGTPAVYASHDQIYVVRLHNPQPQRAVASLALEATDEDWSTPMFFAITLDPADAPSNTGKE